MCSTLSAQLESTGDKKRPTGHQKIGGVRKQPRLLGRDSSRQHAATSGARGRPSRVALAGWGWRCWVLTFLQPHTNTTPHQEECQPLLVYTHGC